MKLRIGFEDKKYRSPDQLQRDLGDGWKKKIFEIVFTNLCMTVYPDGLRGFQARSFNRILDDIDLSPTNAVEIAIEKVDYEFLKTVFNHENAKVSPLQSRIFCLIQDSINYGGEIASPEPES